MKTAEGLVVRKTITVQALPERAFEAFTERIGEWWPFRSHSIHGDEVETVVFEGREGGRLYERTAAGDEADWGTVLAFERRPASCSNGVSIRRCRRPSSR